jgi:type VI secretion system protein ImpC
MEETQSQKAAELEKKVITKGTWDAIYENTKLVKKDEVKDLIQTFTRALGDKMASRSGSVTQSFKSAYEAIDAKLSSQLAAIMHSPKFQKLEGSWRGLKYLLDNSDVGSDLRIEVLNCRKSELMEDLAKDIELSEFYKKTYGNCFGTPGGIPYGAMIGDYEFENHPEDIQMLRNVSQVAAAAFCPFIASTSCKMLGLESWDGLHGIIKRDIDNIFDNKRYAAWKSFRKTDESRFVVLTMPRTLARYPYGSNTERVKEFNYE